MKRRDFVIGFGGVAASGWPVIVSAQQAAKSPTIGFMGAGSPVGWSQWTTAFQERMRELGWVEGRNLVMEYGWAEGSADRYAEIARDFARLKVDVIVTVGGDAAKLATSTIPIVVAMMPDPVGTGLVASLARRQPYRAFDQGQRPGRKTDRTLEGGHSWPSPRRGSRQRRLFRKLAGAQ